MSIEFFAAIFKWITFLKLRIRINIRVRKRAIQRQVIFKKNLDTRNVFIPLKLFVKCSSVNYPNIHSVMYILVLINNFTPSS